MRFRDLSRICLPVPIAYGDFFSFLNEIVSSENVSRHTSEARFLFSNKKLFYSFWCLPYHGSEQCNMSFFFTSVSRENFHLDLISRSVVTASGQH